MTMNLEVVGVDNGSTEARWTRTDTILYALGVGAGQDPLDELQFTTENSDGIDQQVIPSYGIVLAGTHALRPVLGDFAVHQVLHGEQSFVVHRPLPVEGCARVSARCTGIYDKGSGALAVTETTLADTETGLPYFTSRSGLFVRGEGGFGVKAPPEPVWDLPARPPDEVLTAVVRPEQALLYRLSGDRNPLHSDPTAARRSGFERPILHGLCTFGMTTRVLVDALCKGDATLVRSMSGRFSRPVTPGCTVSVLLWKEDRRAVFRTLDGDGWVIIDRGTFTWARSSEVAPPDQS